MNWPTAAGVALAAPTGAPIPSASFDGDADGDQDVDGGDFLVWQSQLGTGVSMTAVPEPLKHIQTGVATAVGGGLLPQIRRRQGALR